MGHTVSKREAELSIPDTISQRGTLDAGMESVALVLEEAERVFVMD